MSYKSDKPRRRRINLWLHDNHFDVITSIKGFKGSNLYCEGCEKPYEHEEEHYCENACPVCRRMDCKLSDNTRRCYDCDRLCRSENCYENHKAKHGKQILSLCDKVSNVVLSFYF